MEALEGGGSSMESVLDFYQKDKQIVRQDSNSTLLDLPLFTQQDPNDNFGTLKSVENLSFGDISDDDVKIFNGISSEIKAKPLKKLGNFITALFKGKSQGSQQNSINQVPRSPSPLNLDLSPPQPISIHRASSSDDQGCPPTPEIVWSPGPRIDSVGWNDQVLNEMTCMDSLGQATLDFVDLNDEPVKRIPSSNSSDDDTADQTLTMSRSDLTDTTVTPVDSPASPMESVDCVPLNLEELQEKLDTSSTPEPPADLIIDYWTRFPTMMERSVYMLSHAKLTGQLPRLFMYSLNAPPKKVKACQEPNCEKPGYCIAKTCLLFKPKPRPAIYQGKFTLQEQVCVSNLMLHFMDIHRDTWEEVMSAPVEQSSIGKICVAGMGDVDLTMDQVELAEKEREHEHEPSPLCAHLHHHHLDVDGWQGVAKSKSSWGPLKRSWSDISVDWEEDEIEEESFTYARTPSPQEPDHSWNISSPTTAQAMDWNAALVRRVI